MCGVKSKKFLLSWVLLFVLFVSPCFSEVALTDEEAQEIMSEIESSKKVLTELKEISQKQIESLENSLKTSQDELENVKNISQEQKKSYEKQLKEEKKKRILPWTIAGIESFISVLILIVAL